MAGASRSRPPHGKRLVRALIAAALAVAIPVADLHACGVARPHTGTAMASAVRIETLSMRITREAIILTPLPGFRIEPAAGLEASFATGPACVIDLPAASAGGLAVAFDRRPERLELGVCDAANGVCVPTTVPLPRSGMR